VSDVWLKQDIHLALIDRTLTENDTAK
jgi:hypothetical protein